VGVHKIRRSIFGRITPWLRREVAFRNEWGASTPDAAESGVKVG